MSTRSGSARRSRLLWIRLLSLRNRLMFGMDAVYFAHTGSDQPFKKDEEAGEVCIPNISPVERRKRQRYAIRVFLITLFVLVALVALGVNPLWRLPLFFMFSAATT